MTTGVTICFYCRLRVEQGVEHVCMSFLQKALSVIREMDEQDRKEVNDAERSDPSTS